MRLRRLLTPLLAAVLAATALAATPALPDAGADLAADPDRWADADEATIFPSTYTVTNGAGCTSNFIFEQFREVNDRVVRDVFIGYAAHCAGLGGSTDTNGCVAGSEPLGTEVAIDGASQPGTLAYSSWHTMIEVGEATDSAACRFNDFALVKLHPDDHDSVNPSMPFFGGPHGIGGDSALGDDLYTVGDSSLRLGISELGPKYEYSTGMTGDGWIHRTYAVSPGIPGDSGSGHMQADGAAMGVTSTLGLLPFPGSNGIVDLAMALDYLDANTDLDVQLADGTEAFDNQLP